MDRSSPLLAGLQILIVEDDAIVANDMADAFQRAAAEVLGPIDTVEAALGYIRGAPRLDGAVVDVNLQGELAFPVADMLLERGVPFVFTTAYGSSDIPRRYARIGHCSKPVNPAELIEAFTWLQRARD